MQSAFSSTFRRFEHIEIIDIKSESELIDTWSDCGPVIALRVLCSAKIERIRRKKPQN